MDIFSDALNVDLEHWLRIELTSGLGVTQLERLLPDFKFSLADLFAAREQTLLRLGLVHHQIMSLRQPRQKQHALIVKWLARSQDHFCIPINHRHYPVQLRRINSPPVMLFGIGNVDILQNPNIAIVGARKASIQGKQTAKLLSAGLVNFGWTITSGLAIGIDTQVHEGCLQANGETIAVLGTGVNVPYPKRNYCLFRRIVEQGGCILSEFQLDTPPKPFHFPRRNRIISGLSNGVLVVEADLKSGSLVTAKYGLEQNKEIFAVPGSIHNPLSKGCHQLIQQGAKLVEQVSDINEEFPQMQFTLENLDTKNPKKNLNEGLATDKLLASVGYEATPLDVVVQRSGLPVKVVLAKLLEYELRGLLAAVPGGYSRLGE